MSRISLGYPEVLHITGTALLIANQFTAGIIFCVLGFLGSIGRLGVEMNAKEKEERDAEKLREDFSSAGVVLSKIFENFLTNNAKNTNRTGSGFH